jgi:hypothetical protein
MSLPTIIPSIEDPYIFTPYYDEDDDEEDED